MGRYRFVSFGQPNRLPAPWTRLFSRVQVPASKHADRVCTAASRRNSKRRNEMVRDGARLYIEREVSLRIGRPPYCCTACIYTYHVPGMIVGEIVDLTPELHFYSYKSTAVAVEMSYFRQTTLNIVWYLVPSATKLCIPVLFSINSGCLAFLYRYLTFYAGKPDAW